MSDIMMPPKKPNQTVTQLTKECLQLYQQAPSMIADLARQYFDRIVSLLELYRRGWVSPKENVRPWLIHFRTWILEECPPPEPTEAASAPSVPSPSENP